MSRGDVAPSSGADREESLAGAFAPAAEAVAAVAGDAVDSCVAYDAVDYAVLAGDDARRFEALYDYLRTDFAAGDLFAAEFYPESSVDHLVTAMDDRTLLRVFDGGRALAVELDGDAAIEPVVDAVRDAL